MEILLLDTLPVDADGPESVRRRLGAGALGGISVSISSAVWSDKAARGLFLEFVLFLKCTDGDIAG